MGAHLEFTAEAAGEHADYGHTDPVRYGTSIGWWIDCVRQFTGTCNATCNRAVGRTARKAIRRRRT